MSPGSRIHHSTTWKNDPDSWSPLESRIRIEPCIHIVPGRAGGRKFQKKKNYNYIAKKEFAYRMRARRPTSATPKPFLCCERAFCCSMVVMWPVLMSWSCLRREMKSCGWLWGDVGWATVVSCDVACHVIWCGWHVIWCDVIACVVSCHMMHSDVMVMTCYLFCPAMGWNVVSLRCHWLWGHVVWFEVVLWQSGDPNNYSGLQSTAPVLLCTTKYYCSTTLYYKVLVQYFSAKY